MEVMYCIISSPFYSAELLCKKCIRATGQLLPKAEWHHKKEHLGGETSLKYFSLPFTDKLFCFVGVKFLLLHSHEYCFWYPSLSRSQGSSHGSLTQSFLSFFYKECPKTPFQIPSAVFEEGKSTLRRKSGVFPAAATIKAMCVPLHVLSDLIH